ncbi:MAG: hypothetical protein V3V35_02050 [Dehalococcoidia bacterium]
MDRQQPESGSIESADIHISVFPHLDEFMAIDLRSPDHPQVRVVGTGDFLTPDYFRELEQQFSQMLREPGPPFMNLMALPTRLQMLLQQKGMERLAKLFGGEGTDAKKSRISLFLCIGPILTMSDDEVSMALKGFFEDRFPQAFVDECGSTFRRLLAQEKQRIAQGERDALRQAVLGDSDQFFTLWQDRPGGGFSPQ